MHDRLSRIEWLLVDVDGVLTDGGITYGDTGLEIKTFHVRDGSGLKLWTDLGKKAGIITGRSSPIVDRRAKELGFTTVIQGAHNKLAGLERVQKEHGVSLEQMAYVGDDLPDLPVLMRVGFGVAVADACLEAREAAHLVTKAPGGRGAVRETIEVILRAQGVWQEIVNNFANPASGGR